jgi:integral membrane protein
MKQLFSTRIGRLQLLGYLEGISLLLLLFVAVPLKHWANNAAMVHALGPVHGVLFLWYIFQTLSIGVEQRWEFKKTTWKILVACIIPFGTFYIGSAIAKIAFPGTGRRPKD